MAERFRTVNLFYMSHVVCLVGGKSGSANSWKGSSKGTKRGYDDAAGSSEKRTAIRCYECHGWGHLSKDCPSKKSRENGDASKSNE